MVCKNQAILKLTPFFEEIDSEWPGQIFVSSFQALEHNILPLCLENKKSQLNVISSMNPSLYWPLK